MMPSETHLRPATPCRQGKPEAHREAHPDGRDAVRAAPALESPDSASARDPRPELGTKAQSNAQPTPLRSARYLGRSRSL